MSRMEGSPIPSRAAENAANGTELSMVLLAAEPAATAVTEVLTTRLGARVEAVTTLTACRRALERQQCDLLLLEESLTAASSDGLDEVLATAGTVLCVEVNFALVSADRVLRQVQAALRWRSREELHARTAARQTLQQEWNAALTGLLMESQLALRQAEPALVPALQRLVDLAEHLCEQLQL